MEEDPLVEQIKQIARDCVRLKENNNGSPLLVKTHKGVDYCGWLTQESIEIHGESGIIVCPYADSSVIVEEEDNLSWCQKFTTAHPGCRYRNG